MGPLAEKTVEFLMSIAIVAFWIGATCVIQAVTIMAVSGLLKK